MAERQYTPGLLDRLRGRDPNNPNAPKAPRKPTIDESRRAMMKERQDRLGAKTGDGNIYKNGAGTQQSAQRMGMPANKPSANAAVNTAVPNKRGPVSGATRGALGLPAQSTGQQTVRRTDLPKRSTSAAPLPVAAGRGQVKGVPEPARNPRPTAGRSPELPFSRKSPEAAAKQVVANAAASGTPKDKPTPAPKQSWWDKFSDDHKLSADKSYADYKRLMGDS